MTISEIAALTNGALIGAGDGAETIEIRRVASLDQAGDDEIAFLEKTLSSGGGEITTAAACLLVPENFDAALPCPLIKVKNPKLAFARVAAVLHRTAPKTGVHRTARIHETARLGAAVFVGAFASVGEDSSVGENSQIHDGARIGNRVFIGANSIVHPNAVVYDNVKIGDDCVIHAGCVIGADGFGYVRDAADGYVKFPQIGTVVIENRVEIGANSCVDRGALGETRIGAGTKIDNLVQIAHNVRIGRRTVIAAQTGISGSTVIEDDCVIGGQVGMGDHARVLSGAVIGSQAGVLPGKIVRAGVWWGTPVQPLDEYKRQNAHLKGIARLREELKTLKKQFSEWRKTV